jgi:hypothetical protein
MIAFRRLVWAVPLAYALHVADQTSGGFAGWFNGAVGGSMDSTAYALVILGFIAVALGLTAWTSLTMATPLVVLLVVWSSAHLFWDPLFHLGLTVAQRRYSPGLATGLLICFPLSLWLGAAAVRQGVLGWRGLLIANLAGGVGMLLLVQLGRLVPRLGASI